MRTDALGGSNSMEATSTVTITSEHDAAVHNAKVGSQRRKVLDIAPTSRRSPARPLGVRRRPAGSHCTSGSALFTTHRRGVRHGTTLLGHRFMLSAKLPGGLPDGTPGHSSRRSRSTPTVSNPAFRLTSRCRRQMLRQIYTGVPRQYSDRSTTARVRRATRTHDHGLAGTAVVRDLPVTHPDSHGVASRPSPRLA
jgi:hypothetical protein